jgi:hypothetical protein
MISSKLDLSINNTFSCRKDYPAGISTTLHHNNLLRHTKLVNSGQFQEYS